MEGSGITRREHLESISRQLGRPDPELKGPAVPEILAYLMEWFYELSSGRRFGFSGPEPLGWSDIQAWDELTDRRLHKWEAQILKQLDNLWLNQVNDRRIETSNSG